MTTTEVTTDRLVADIPIVVGQELGDRCAICFAPAPRRSTFGWLVCDHQIATGYEVGVTG